MAEPSQKKVQLASPSREVNMFSETNNTAAILED
jgi:hypothetical protein